MISTNLMGGIGNMMFQIASIESACKRHGLEAGYYNAVHNMKHLSAEKVHNPSMDHGIEYEKIFKNFNWNYSNRSGFTSNIMVPYGYIDNYNFKDSTIYDGFFQSEKWFYSKEFVENLFEFSDYVKDQVSKEFLEHESPGEDSCFIHVRRGDRVDRVDPIHPITTIEYLEKAIDMMGEKKYYIFSDDMEWCYSNIPTGTGTIFSTHKDYVDLYLMSQCRNAIVGPSSFSWWGAYLGNKDKIIAPHPWVYGDSIDISDVIPERWEQILL